MDKIVFLWAAMLDTLKQMGAASVREGDPYGLRGYADYHRKKFPGSFRKDAWEEPLTAGVRLGLEQRGFVARTEEHYPTGGRCDLVVQFTPSETIWIECKTAYRQHLKEAEAGAPYRYCYNGDGCYDPGRGTHTWVSGVADIARKDVPKLLELSADRAQYIGVLLLGFDKKDAPLTNQELDERLGACFDDWSAVHGRKEGVTWGDSNLVRKEHGFRERVWFWCRPVAGKIHS